MVTVTVARAGLPRDSLAADFPEDAEWKRPWRDRETAEVEVDPETSYGAVIDAAIMEFGARSLGRPYAIAFWTSDHDSEGLRLGTFALPVVRDEGSADWRPWAEVTIGDAMRARERGLFPGDPLRPYAFVLPKIGNGVLPSWPDLINMLEVLRTVAEVLALPGGIAASYSLLRSKPVEAVQAVETHAEDWAARGLDPYTLDEYLDEHPWHSADLAAALACSEAEASAVLWSLGFAQAASGLWRRAATPEATTLSGIRRLLISTAARFATAPQLAAEIRRRLEHLVQTGAPPPERDWDELPWLKPTMPGDSALQSRTRAAFDRMLGTLRKGGR